MRYFDLNLRRLLLLAALATVALGALPGAATAADRAFAPKFQTHTRGSLTSAANTLFSCAGNGGACVDNRAGTGSDLTNGGNMAYVNADADATTFNSSAATLTIPAGATVAWAGLYWGADSSAGTGGAAPPAAALRGNVLFDTPAAGSYSTVTSSQIDIPTGFANRFQAFADVTAEVTAGGSGTYWAANVQGGTGADRYGGWTLVVAYRLASQPVRNLSVYDGLVTVLGGGTSTLAFNNFTAPASGTVRANLGFTTWEGELGYTFDGARLNGTTLSDAQNPAANFFNASIATNGTRVTSKTPDYVNQMGFDSDVVTADGLIANGATSATMQLTSSIETYHAGVATFAVDQIPELPSNTAAPGLSGTALDGQTLTATPGSWSGTTSFSYAYQWQRCNAAGASCVNIGGATGSTYTLTAADVDLTVRAVVTATNTEGTGSASSAVSAAVQAIAPGNTALPTISGATTDGQTLTAGNGSWSGSAPFAYSYQWQRCDSAGLLCSDIAGATASTYGLTSPDVANTIRVVVTATNSGGSAGGTSAQTAVVAPLAPANSALPTTSGTARDGQTLTATTGSWTGTTPMTHAFQWQRCDAAGASCVNIASAIASTYSLVPADVGGTVRVVVTATNAGGSTSANSAVTGTVAALAPANTTAPSFSGTLRDGQTLTAANGSWTGTPTITYAQRWQRCNAAGASCADISGATGSTYVLAPADVGSTIRLVLTASNAGGSVAANSSVSALVAALGPGNTALPAISGTTTDGQTLSASNGSWTGTAPIGFTYQWRSCDTAGVVCSDIIGATGSTYDLVPADVGETIRVAVTATNGGGSQSATSAQTATVLALSPANTAAPTVSGTALDGQTLTAANGSWTGTPTINFSYQWQRCEADGTMCGDIDGETAQTYALATADVGGKVRVIVTATNAGGFAAAASLPTGTVAALGPGGTGLPIISGTARDGQTLSATNGTWSGTAPFTYAYQWQLCDSAGAGCSPISGATSSTYDLVPADVGNTVRVAVTATNAAGSDAATSAATTVVQAIAPANSSAPAVSGTVVDGDTLSADPGSWTGTPTITFTHQWESCNALGLSCAPISGATSSSYQLAPGDVGNRLRVVVTGSNAGGSDSASSAASALVSAQAPANSSPPTLSGSERDGQTLSASPGSWTGTAPITHGYQWQRCDAAGANCANIAGATGSTYDLIAADVGGTVRAIVTATNAAGSVSAPSAASATIAPLAPSNSSLPSFSGTLRDGQTLTAANGSWTGTPTIDYAYQWQRCDADGSNCADMSGETGATHELTAADVGRTVRVVVTASNGGGPASATSPVSAVVLALGPGSTSPPAISGIERDEQTLTASTGAWSGTAPISFGYQWQRCDGLLCEDITGATGSSYDLVWADIGKTIQVVVTATNGDGSAPATSDPSGVIQALAPANSSLPSVGGTLRDGQTLAAGDGAWTGTAPFDYAYRWQRCDADGNGCVDIAGADQPTYDLTSADLGNTIRLQVTASNDAGSDVATSVASGVVQALAPAAGSTPPAISGTVRDGQTLTADNGSFTGTGPFDFTYQWQRCDSDGTNCADITGATGSSWSLGGEDAGHRMRVLVTATNDAGSATAASAVSSVVQALAPDNVDPPGVLGTLRDGETLNADTGDWTGTGPIAHGYQWQRCDAQGADCQDISGATGSSYELTDADAGKTVRVLVTGTNGAGSDLGASPVSGLVHGIVPANAGDPSISGTPRDGETLTADDGDWTGTGPITRSFQWQRCDAQGANCQDIGGATGSTYDLGADDVGHTLRVVVTATNIEGFEPAASQQSGVVTATSPPQPPADPDPPAPTPPVTTPPAASPPSSPGPAADLSSLPGSLLSGNSCQQASGARVLNFKVPGAGRLRIRVAPNGVVTAGQPLLAQALVTPKAARKLGKALRQVSYTLGGRKLGAKRKAPYVLKITPALLSAARRQTLVVQVVPKKGKPRVSQVDLSSEPCPDLFQVVHRPGTRGSLLTFRVDTRKPLRTVTFKAPTKLLAAKGAKGSAGELRLGVAGQAARILHLKFPKNGSKTRSLAAAGGPQVVVKGSNVTVSNLPGGTGIVQLRLKGRGLKKTPKATLRALLQVDGGPARGLKQSLGAKRR